MSWVSIGVFAAEWLCFVSVTVKARAKAARMVVVVYCWRGFSLKHGLIDCEYDRESKEKHSTSFWSEIYCVVLSVGVVTTTMTTNNNNTHFKHEQRKDNNNNNHFHNLHFTLSLVEEWNLRQSFSASSLDTRRFGLCFRQLYIYIYVKTDSERFAHYSTEIPPILGIGDLGSNFEYILYPARLDGDAPARPPYLRN